MLVERIITVCLGFGYSFASNSYGVTYNCHGMSTIRKRGSRELVHLGVRLSLGLKSRPQNSFSCFILDFASQLRRCLCSLAVQLLSLLHHQWHSDYGTSWTRRLGLHLACSSWTQHLGRCVVCRQRIDTLFRR